ncbi:MAG TPA: DUF1254 domain-containing protein [Acidimicrobiales bacterium]|nr:DUF1254 domain-containing protein [Acidimicrobiales bacterium]
MSDELVALAAEAFVYGFPLVFDLQEVDQFTRSGIGGVPAVAFNEFGHAVELAGPETTFVSVNNDTVYSIAQVDLSGGAVRLDVPDTAGRYYVLQFVDAWTNNFAYIGHRATGTAAGSFLLLPPHGGDQGNSDLPTIRFPTTVATIVGRWAVAGSDDLPAVRALQARLVLTPVTGAIGVGPPAPTSSAAEDIVFFEQMRVWMQAFPPAARDLDYQGRFEPLGLFANESPYVDPDPELAGALRQGYAHGQVAMEEALKTTPSPKQNGWHLTYHVFDYNLDFFEIGALDDPKWKLEVDPALRYMVRAGAARGGLWGNHGYEAAYAMVYEDADGNQLNGASRYALRFDAPPPVGAFWSVTMYDTPDFFLVANPINRYSIGDRTSGLRVAADGSLTVVMQPEAPDDPGELANWLPTPEGDFRPLLRMYEPDEQIIDGSYELPPIVKLG